MTTHPPRKPRNPNHVLIRDWETFSAAKLAVRMLVPITTVRKWFRDGLRHRKLGKRQYTSGREVRRFIEQGEYTCRAAAECDPTTPS